MAALPAIAKVVGVIASVYGAYSASKSSQSIGDSNNAYTTGLGNYLDRLANIRPGYVAENREQLIHGFEERRTQYDDSYAKVRAERLIDNPAQQAKLQPKIKVKSLN